MRARSFGATMVAEQRSEWSKLKELDAIRADRAARDRATRDGELAANATPETLRHHRQAVVDRMLARDQLTSEQHRAAREIAMVFEAITRSLMAHIGRYDTNSKGDHLRGIVWSLSPSLWCAHRERYLPWAASEAKVMVRHNVNRCDLALMVAVDNHGAEQIRQRLGMRRESVIALIRESLYRYAEIGGWVDIPPLPAGALVGPENWPLTPGTVNG